MGTLETLHGTAIKHDRELREMVYAARTSWVRLAVKLIPFYDKAEYEQLGYTWMGWLDTAMHMNREMADRMMRLVRPLLEGIPVPEIEKIIRNNCETLVKYVPIPKRFAPEIVKAAQTLSNPEFIEMLKSGKNFWEPGAKEKHCQIRIQCGESLKELWEAACAKVGEMPGPKAFERICGHIMVCEQVEMEE